MSSGVPSTAVAARLSLSSARAEIPLIQYLNEVFAEDWYRSGMLALEVEQLVTRLSRTR
jgi:hypothetical protein